MCTMHFYLFVGNSNNTTDFSLDFCKFINNKYSLKMSEELNEDIFKEVRKRGASKSPIEKENFETLQSVEESIKSKTKDTITPLKYFNALMTMLNTNTKRYRSVFISIRLLYLVALFTSVDSSLCS